jgi:hypothetical protein
MLRKILAVVLGIVAAVIIIIAIEALGHAIYPPPGDLDITNREAMEAYVAGLPLAALLFVMVAWIAATFAGGLLACFIAKQMPLIYASIVGVLVLLGTIINLMSIPHPLWFSIISVLAIIATIFVAGWLGSNFSAKPGSEQQ